VGLVVHPIEKAKFRSEIIAISGLSDNDILDAPALRSPHGLEWLNSYHPEWLFSVYFGFILKPDVLRVPTNGVVNLHPSFLPYNKGAYPNVWSIVDKTPAGVTLHFIDEGIDTGEIITQKEVPVLPTDTGQTLYMRLEEAARDIFIESWDLFVQNRAPRFSQNYNGTTHKFSDVSKIDSIKPEQMVRAGDFVDLLRARTFPPYKGVYLDLPDRRIYIQVNLTEEVK
jgi:methionyl-tRNA formyltransferase